MVWKNDLNVGKLKSMNRSVYKLYTFFLRKLESYSVITIPTINTVKYLGLTYEAETYMKKL